MTMTNFGLLGYVGALSVSLWMAANDLFLACLLFGISTVGYGYLTNDPGTFNACRFIFSSGMSMWIFGDRNPAACLLSICSWWLVYFAAVPKILGNVEGMRILFGYIICFLVMYSLFICFEDHPMLPFYIGAMFLVGIPRWGSKDVTPRHAASLVWAAMNRLWDIVDRKGFRILLIGLNVAAYGYLSLMGLYDMYISRPAACASLGVFIIVYVGVYLALMNMGRFAQLIRLLFKNMRCRLTLTSSLLWTSCRAAAAATAPTTTNEEQIDLTNEQEILCCPVCLDDPIKNNVSKCMLPCGHMICGVCHYKIVVEVGSSSSPDNNNNNLFVCCPLCRQRYDG